MPRSTTIENLSNDILRDILDYIETDLERSVSIDRRAYLSVESFRPVSPPPPPRAQDIGNFRLVCRRFAQLGIPHQFTRIATRFSASGLQRLDRICSRQHLAKHTRKFSYLLPDFYADGGLHTLGRICKKLIFVGRDRVRDLIQTADGFLGSLDASYFEKKAQAQKSIVHTGDDVKTLKRAMAAFKNLQHVQILRLQDEADCCLVDYVNEDPEEHRRLVDLRWSIACLHATETVGEALASSHSPFSRFSGPMMNAESAVILSSKAPKSLGYLAERLTCLELHFEDGYELKEKMLELSVAFKHIFQAAKNLQALHIGFPSRRPLQIRLETLFHDIHFEKLRAFGVQAWRLQADEIIRLARRHRKTLRGLRLRDVLLLQNSMWRDVLEMLHEEMEMLEWVSLRRIDYSQHFDEMWAGSMEVPDYPPSGSDSDVEESFHAHLDIEDDQEAGHDEDHDWEDHSDDQSTADTDHGPEAEQIALSPDTPASVPFCTCSRNSYSATVEDLGDNGRFVVHQQRKLWEKWVIGKCPEHGPP